MFQKSDFKLRVASVCRVSDCSKSKRTGILVGQKKSCVLPFYNMCSGLKFLHFSRFLRSKIKVKQHIQYLGTMAEDISHANRKFYEIPSQSSVHEESKQKNDLGQKDLLTLVNGNVVGKDKTFSGPFGLRKGKDSSHSFSSTKLS